MSATARRASPWHYLLAALLVLAATPVWAVDPIELDDPVLQQRYRALTQELRCMQCQNQSIADSPVGLAGDLRREVRELLLAGASDQAIRDHLRDRYGDFILFRPDLNARTAWLWAAPFVLLMAGVWVAVRVIRGRAALAAQPDDEVDGRV